jgi:hypothetical protein
LADKLYANVSHDNGETFAETVEVDPTLNPCNCCTTSSVYAADGKLAVLYREETNNDRDMYLVSWDQAHNQVSRTRVSVTPWKTDSCPMSYYTIARNGEGFTAVWPTKDQVFFARLDSKGETLSPAEIETPGRSGHRTGMLALSASNGATLVAWKNDNALGWQLYDAEGQPVGSAGSVASEGSGVAGITTDERGFLLFK